jgi:hypothetical protein
MDNVTLNDIGGGLIALSGVIGFILVWLDGRQEAHRQIAREAPGGPTRTMWGVGAILPGNAPLDANRKTGRDLEHRL